MLNKIKKDKSGFTIIEVMIVLAIAALILVVVLVAIPQLQRNQRNAARRDIAGRIKAELDNFAGNNNGVYPNAVVTAGTGGNPVRQNYGRPGVNNTFFRRYLECPTSGAVPVTCGINITDPSSGSAVGTGTFNGATVTSTVGVGAGVALANRAGSISFAEGTVCQGETIVAGNARNYTFRMQLEGGAIFCLDNR